MAAKAKVPPPPKRMGTFTTTVHQAGSGFVRIASQRRKLLLGVLIGSAFSLFSLARQVQRAEGTFVSPLRTWHTCTQEQLDIVHEQLPDKGSLSRETSCPNAIWIEKEFSRTSRIERNVTSKPLIAIYVGCNKGFDAVNTLRMLSSNGNFDKERWKNKFFEGTVVAPGACGQENVPQYTIPADAIIRTNAVVHCIEAMPNTATKLKETANALGWQESFVVNHAAISSTDGTALFPSNHASSQLGVEHLGLSDCLKEEYRQYCTEVPQLRLDSYLEKFVPPGDIDLLSVDVEG
jgi:FkbM family methyltransferase